jgi:hypothetical protein
MKNLTTKMLINMKIHLLIINLTNWNNKNWILVRLMIHLKIFILIKTQIMIQYKVLVFLIFKFLDI